MSGQYCKHELPIAACNKCESPKEIDLKARVDGRSVRYLRYSVDLGKVHHSALDEYEND